ncbi:methyl-accepting chemotaxis protein [Photobacterium chitinilyticum]|uniref:Methyl-accepting chemotaxis protein n=1 Tax=Photobacterium chitinilyticum TaxID=2485123 RepID=A0A3S3QQJ5_9GAMM|nr:methyl-accepting chemotaxis protein [Photobacterium chitinilyticum]RWX56196.1 methyl-accepting chemotaxis protein [Photobacterium chitinilyticum]
MSFKDLSIGKKIALVFSAIIAIIIALGVFLMSELSVIRAGVLNFSDSTVPSLLSVDEIVFEVSYVRRTQYAILTYSDLQQIRKRVDKADQQNHHIETLLDAYKASVGSDATEHERQALRDITQAWGNYQKALNGFAEAAVKGDFDTAQPILAGTFNEFNDLTAALEELKEVNLGFVKRNRTEMLASTDRVTTMSFAAVSALILFMVIMNLFLTRQICRPLNQVIDLSSEIASGNLTHHLKRDEIGNDELGVLADSCVEMQDNLRDLVGEIVAAVTQLSAAVEEVSAVSEQSSQGMQQQQNEITMVATAMDQMKATVAEVASNTEVASVSATSASDEAKLGCQDIQQSIKSILSVSQEIENAGQMVEQLEKESNNISMVVDVIRDIAEQTNLLALNAAIEAARAGEQGRGFAVVADEVRTLAGRTQQSTGEIITIIEKLQKSASEAKEATTESCGMIRGCVEQSQNTGKMIENIEQRVAQIADMGQQVASACSEQDSVTEELGRNVESINQSSTEVAIGASQTAQASVELGQLAANLQTMMSRFRVS